MNKNTNFSKNNILYYKDFNIYSFKGSNEVEFSSDYPFVEYEELGDGKIRLKFCLSAEKQFEEFYNKEKNSYYKNSSYQGDGEYIEDIHLYIKNGIRYQFIYYRDTIDHKNTPSEFFLNEFSIENSEMRKTIILKRPEDTYQPKMFFNHGPNLIEIEKNMIYSEIIEKYSWENKMLSVETTISYWDGKTKVLEKKCYNLEEYSINWFHYFGFSFKTEC